MSYLLAHTVIKSFAHPKAIYASDPLWRVWWLVALCQSVNTARETFTFTGQVSHPSIGLNQGFSIHSCRTPCKANYRRLTNPHWIRCARASGIHKTKQQNPFLVCLWGLLLITNCSYSMHMYNYVCKASRVINLFMKM